MYFNFKNNYTFMDQLDSSYLKHLNPQVDILSQILQPLFPRIIPTVCHICSTYESDNPPLRYQCPNYNVSICEPPKK